MSIGLTKDEIIKKLDKTIRKGETISAAKINEAIAEVIIDNNKAIEEKLED